MLSRNIQNSSVIQPEPGQAPDEGDCSVLLEHQSRKER